MTRLFGSGSFSPKIKRISNTFAILCLRGKEVNKQQVLTVLIYLYEQKIDEDGEDIHLYVNVTYNKTKRLISDQKDGDVQGFCRLFLTVFSNVLQGKVTPIQVKFL